MKRKGISEIVATVLLIGMALAGTATVYQVVRDNTQNAKTYTPNIELTKLDLEHCYVESGETRLVLRNTNPEAINASLVHLFIESKPVPESQYSASPEIVDPQQTFEITLQRAIGEDTLLKFASNDQTVERRCLTIN